ncbi:MAG: UDP-N-acetylmuramate dehydrogenase [Anaeroplasmataceae bacterium]|nr:UDP-N-acetylmuramate dehydrogenase [Anaeroplasmataceae bacterium]
MNFCKYVIDNDLGKIETDRFFKEFTTIGCGGKISYLYSPKDLDSLIKAYIFLNQNNVRFFILGNGSNILASDETYDGVVISLRHMPYSYTIKNDTLECSAFYPTIKLAHDLALEEVGDLSFLGGIPGLLGGAIYNNSGAYQKEIKDSLIDVTYLDTAGKLVTIPSSQCNFGYRKSFFHTISGIIVSARFKVCKMKTLEILQQRSTHRKLSQPLENKSMGSIFKNNSLISAWKVIDALGMRGFNINDAAVSKKHANFIINLGKAKSSDILNLIQLIQRRAELEFGIKLTYEITIV